MLYGEIEGRGGIVGEFGGHKIHEVKMRGREGIGTYV